MLLAGRSRSGGGSGHARVHPLQALQQEGRQPATCCVGSRCELPRLGRPLLRAPDRKKRPHEVLVHRKVLWRGGVWARRAAGERLQGKSRGQRKPTRETWKGNKVKHSTRDTIRHKQTYIGVPVLVVEVGQKLEGHDLGLRGPDLNIRPSKPLNWRCYSSGHLTWRRE